jgi:hypothetical protein
MREADLYDGVQAFIEQRFQDRIKPRYGEFNMLSAVTAKSGAPATGHWSKPDLSLVLIWRPKYNPSWQLDLHGFEVKTSQGCTPASVHEALSHAAFVHFTHLVWHFPEWEQHPVQARDIYARCERYGVGLITFSAPHDADSYVVRLAAQRHSPSPEIVDEYIETRFERPDLDKFDEWLRGRR